MLRRVIIFALAAIVLMTAVQALLPPRPTGKHTQIIVDKGRNRLYLYQQGRLLRSYPVATGREISLTPEGRFHIVSKIIDPHGGPAQASLYGSRWMGLATQDGPDGSRYGIHGTNEPHSIGKHASAGCVRMHTADVEELFRLVSIGTQVEIIVGSPVIWLINDLVLNARNAGIAGKTATLGRKSE